MSPSRAMIAALGTSKQAAALVNRGLGTLAPQLTDLFVAAADHDGSGAVVQAEVRYSPLTW